MTLPPRLPSRIWAIQKEIKDAYPEKICHMPKRHEKKEECQEKRKGAYPKRYATCPQGMSKRKKEKDSPHPWKIKKRDGSCKGVHPSSTKKNKYSHTLAHLDQIV